MLHTLNRFTENESQDKQRLRFSFERNTVSYLCSYEDVIYENPGFSNTNQQHALHSLDQYSILTEGIRLCELNQHRLIKPVGVLPVKISHCGVAMLFTGGPTFIYEYRDIGAVFMVAFRGTVMGGVGLCLKHLMIVEMGDFEGCSSAKFGPLTLAAVILIEKSGGESPRSFLSDFL